MLRMLPVRARTLWVSNLQQGPPLLHITWGSHISSWIVLTTLGQRLIIMMLVIRTQTHLHQPWRLDSCHHSFITWANRVAVRHESKANQQERESAF